LSPLKHRHIKRSMPSPGPETVPLRLRPSFATRPASCMELRSRGDLAVPVLPSAAVRFTVSTPQPDRKSSSTPLPIQMESFHEVCCSVTTTEASLALRLRVDPQAPEWFSRLIAPVPTLFFTTSLVGPMEDSLIRG